MDEGRISDKEWLRYERQMLIRGWDRDVQERLKRATVFVAGAGGLGGPVLLYLALAGVGILRICDRDLVEPSNLNRQILHTGQRVGMRKTDSAETALLEANPFVQVSKRYAALTAENAGEIVGDADVIMDCLDNFEARHVLNRLSVRKRIPLIHAGVSGLRGQITFLQPPETPCLRCLFPIADPSGAVPIVGCTAGVLGTLQAAECIKYLTGQGQVLRNRLLLWDGETMEFHEAGVERNPECPVCGDRSARPAGPVIPSPSPA
ncbi:MAG: HesA/MoeB/ThiF family protein [Thermodesulfobacteriota bacterium]